MLIAQEISRRMKSELGITVSVGVSFNKIFAKLGSDYKKPDAITTMYKSEFKQKAWSLPVADLLYVGKSTNRKLALFGIKTIGDLARADEDVLNSHLGKMGSILWSFANGYDDSPVKLENTHAPIKSVGNSTTTPTDLVCDEDVKIVLYILAESVAARLRENGFRCRVVEISVRDNELFSFTRQKKIDHATNITGEIAAYAYQIFKVEVRVFDEPTKKIVYTKQTEEAKSKGISNCPLCALENNSNKKKIWKLSEMDADHVTAWSKGGVTDISNCQMLCKTHNRAKGNK